jgi:hypothetical protein
MGSRAGSSQCSEGLHTRHNGVLAGAIGVSDDSSERDDSAETAGSRPSFWFLMPLVHSERFARRSDKWSRVAHL